MYKSNVVDSNILYARGDVDTPVRIRVAKVTKLLKWSVSLLEAPTSKANSFKW
jgi:hypothetical protein